jgi:hypothetical protein
VDWGAMKCPKCKKDLKQDFLRVYKLGLLDGKNEYTQHLNKIERIFGHLFRELRIMDIRTPDKINKVYISRKEAEKIIKKMWKNHRSIAYRLSLKVKAQLGDAMSAEAKLRELLNEIEED